MKRAYAKPVLVKRAVLPSVTAGNVSLPASPTLQNG